VRRVIPVDITGDTEKDIVLDERVYPLREVSIVKGSEDPAYAVMRQAIARAPYYRSFVRKYTAGAYLKGTGKLIRVPALFKITKSSREEVKKYLGRVFVLEEQRKVTFTAPNTWDNEVKAYTNSFPDEMQISLETININLYQPTLFGKVSPLSPGAFSYYHFRLEGSYMEGEHLVNRIQVIPRKDNPDLISGYLYIIEDLWCISAVDVRVGSVVLDASVKITCKEIKPGVFMSASTTLKANVNMMGIQVEASYLSAVHYTHVDTGEPDLPPQTKKQENIRKQMDKLSRKENLTTRDAYKLSRLTDKAMEEADTVRRAHKYERRPGNYDLRKDSLAGKRDSLYWAAVRSVPLKPEEVESYAYKEKLKPVNDSLSRTNAAGKDVSGTVISTFMFGHTFKSKDDGKAWIKLGGLSSYVPEYNVVDGFWVGARVTAGVRLGRGAELSFTPEGYYAVSRREWLGSALLTLDYAPRRLGKLTVGGGALSADFNGECGESRMINSVSSALFARNDMKFYDKRYLSIDNEVEVANSLLLSTGLTWQRRRPLENTVGRSLFGKPVEPNLPRHPDYLRPMQPDELVKASVTLMYTPAHYYQMVEGRKRYLPSVYPTFAVKYERAFSPTFHRMELSARQDIRFGLFNRIHWFINGGAFRNTDALQLPDYKHFAATRIPVTEHSLNQGFTLLDSYTYSTSTRWAQANVSWYTPYLLLKHLPFLKRKRYDEAIHLRALAVRERSPYWEAGYSIGLSDIYRIGVFTGFERSEFHAAGVSLSLPLLKLIGM
jgi:hypothetical protein